MHRVVIAFALLLQETAVVRIIAPLPDETVRAQLSIIGSTNLPGFQSAEFAFAYARDDTDTWFTIGRSDVPVEMGELAIWDTASVADAEYTLRVRVFMQDGSFSEAFVTGLRVENTSEDVVATWSATTALPPMEAIASQASPDPIPTATARPTPVLGAPTAVPTNPAALPVGSVRDSLVLGAVLTGVAFLLLGLLIRLRRA
jgi:hypothetical protein